MTLERVCDGDVAAEAFAAMLDIYHEAFSEGTRMPDAKLVELSNRGAAIIFVWKDGGEVLGFAIVAPFVHKGFVHLDYFAIKKDVRGIGRGSELLTALRAELATLFPDMQAMTLETVDDAEGSRIRFYQRQGAKRLRNVPYFFPAYGNHDPVPMEILLFPLNPSFIAKKPFVQDVISTLYTELHAKPENDPALQQLLKRLPNHVESE